MTLRPRHLDDVARPVTLMVGAESVGKTELAAGLCGRPGRGLNFRGSTIACEVYRGEHHWWIDTPGLLRQTDTASNRLTIDALAAHDRILAVLSWDGLATEWEALRPDLENRIGSMVVTFADHAPAAVRESPAATEQRLTDHFGVPVTLVDARHLTREQVHRIEQADLHGRAFRPVPAPDPRHDPAVAPTGHPESDPMHDRTNPSGRSSPGRFGRRLAAVLRPGWGLLCLLGPAAAGVLAANAAAGLAEPWLDRVLDPWLDRLEHGPAMARHLLAGDYGLLAMGPFLLLYALPTVVFFALFLAIYKTSGLVDRLTIAVDPWMRPWGLSGRDLVRVVMGFGCNVPAVVQTRSCAGCSRGACVSAISFGSACSYQLPATLAVFSAAGMAWLGLPYLLLLLVTTLLYVRFTTPRVLRQASARLLLDHRRIRLQAPRAAAVLRDARAMLTDFLRLALPVFVLICLVAAALAWSGALDWLAAWLAPAMALFRLPPEAAIACVLGSIRKDGIAIGLLGGDGGLKVAMTDPGQVLAAVYLAGVALPCLVTLWTVSREMSPRFALRMAGRQLLAAMLFTAAIAWSWPR